MTVRGCKICHAFTITFICLLHVSLIGLCSIALAGGSADRAEQGAVILSLFALATVVFSLLHRPFGRRWMWDRERSTTTFAVLAFLGAFLFLTIISRNYRRPGESATLRDDFAGTGGEAGNVAQMVAYISSLTLLIPLLGLFHAVNAVYEDEWPACRV